MISRRTITERDVRRAARDGSRSLDAREAIVTPAARDLARQLKVELVERQAGRGTRDAARVPAQGVSGSRSPEPITADSLSRPAPPISRPAVAVGADHGGVALKDAIAARLRDLGHVVVDVGTTSTDPVDYPDFAAAVAKEVATRGVAFGIMVDGAGIGSCMAANKVRGVRAAMCYDVTTATNAREHNDANVLTLGGGLIGTRLALAIVETFLVTPFAGGRHAARVEKIDLLDGRA
jgi:ribose 5-phosphate isomerase B